MNKYTLDYEYLDEDDKELIITLLLKKLNLKIVVEKWTDSKKSIHRKLMLEENNDDNR